MDPINHGALEKELSGILGSLHYYDIVPRQQVTSSMTYTCYDPGPSLSPELIIPSLKKIVADIHEVARQERIEAARKVLRDEGVYDGVDDDY